MTWNFSAPLPGWRPRGVGSVRSALDATNSAPAFDRERALGQVGVADVGRVPLNHGGPPGRRHRDGTQAPLPDRDAEPCPADDQHRSSRCQPSASSLAAACAEVTTFSGLAGTPSPVSWAAIAAGVR